MRIDSARMVSLYAELGERGAGQLIERAMEEMSARLTEIQRHADEGDAEALIKSARLLSKMAEQVGMQSFATVAGDVMKAMRAKDGPGLAATLARLQRIGDRSLSAVWDLHDMTI
ncbi:MAG: hypothetical protein Kow0045_11450 [Albidovulum sp.]